MILRLVLVVQPAGGGEWAAAAYPARPRERKTGHGSARTAASAAAMAIREVVDLEMSIGGGRAAR